MVKEAFKPDDDYYKWNCEKYLNSKQFKKVIDYALMGLEFNPDNLDYYSWLGKSYLYLGDYWLAFKYFRKFVDSSPNSIEEVNLLNVVKKHIEKVGLYAIVGKFRSFDFNQAAEWLTIYIESLVDFNNKDEDLEKIYLLLLRIIFPNYRIDYNNHYYKLLTNDLTNELCDIHIYAKNDSLSFGKHKGKKIIEIINIDPSYISWCIRMIENFSLCHESMSNPKIIEQGDYLQILEINLVKHLIIKAQTTQHSIFVIEDEDFDEDSCNESYGYPEKIKETYGKYSGNYVQDVLGYSDNFIDDALGGEPSAYWNID